MHSYPTQHWSPLMCSLMDRVPELKKTQLDRMQPHSAGPAELSVPEPVVEVSCILMMLSGLHATIEEDRIEVWPSVSTLHPSPSHSSY